MAYGIDEDAALAGLDHGHSLLQFGVWCPLTQHHELPPLGGGGGGRGHHYIKIIITGDVIIT